MEFIGHLNERLCILGTVQLKVSYYDSRNIRYTMRRRSLRNALKFLHESDLGRLTSAPYTEHGFFSLNALIRVHDNLTSIGCQHFTPDEWNRLVGWANNAPWYVRLIGG